MNAPTDAARSAVTTPVRSVQSPARRTISVRIGLCAFVLRPRTVGVGVVLCAVVLVAFAASIGVGDFPLSIVDVARILLGGGTRVENVVVLDVALPRALLSVLVGLGLGMAGALTQTVARNPLATPDMLGITSGASAAAVTAIALGSSYGAFFSDVGVPVAALIGAVVGATLMYVLSWRGGIDAFRLVLVGVALTWVFQAIISFALTRARIDDVARAQRWLVGSTAEATWTSVTILIAAVVATMVAVAALHRGLLTLGLGENLARGLGVRTGAVTLAALGTAVVVSAFTVAAAGPLAFVALLAPQIAIRLTRTAQTPPVASGLVGAALVVAADLLCRAALPGGLAVGVVTAALGGPFLIYLMISVSRKASV